MLCPSSVNPSLDVPLSSASSVPCSTKALFTCTVWRNIYRCRHSLENTLLTSMRMLLVGRSQPSREKLPPLLGCPKVNCRTKEEIDRRLDGSKGCSRGRGSMLCPRGEFCLVW